MLSFTDAIAHLLKSGMEQISAGEADRRLKALGYQRNRSERTVYVARELNSGLTWQEGWYGVLESDTRRSAYHFQSRRDEKFKAMQKMRMRIFWTAGNRIETL
jgi:hypothetical protein